jgi:hypothetical protein
MTRQKLDVFPNRKKELLEDADHEFEDVSDGDSSGKSKMECICPKCGKMHVMKIRWIGRGVPHKFCQHCRDRAATLDDRLRR